MPPITAASRPAPELRLGSGERTATGSTAVRRLQRGLLRVGDAPGPLDGRFGPLTRAAVQRFQRAHGLRPTGAVDSATHAALVAVAVLRIGSGIWSAHGSPAVRRLQRGLRRAGDSPGPLDGRFGPRTRAALIVFQASRDLPRSGVAGIATQRALTRRGPSDSGRTPSPRTTPSSGPVSSRHLAPRRLPAPRPAAEPAPSAAPAVPGLPGGWILAGLAMLGGALALRGYLHTRHGTRRAAASALPRGGQQT